MSVDRKGSSAIGPDGSMLVAKEIVRDYDQKPEQDMCLGCKLKGHPDFCDSAPVCMRQFRDDKKDIIFVLPEDL